MPYSSNKDLPASVKKALPAAGLDIFRDAYNAAEALDLSEERRVTAGWSAVKRAFKKDGAKWIAKDAANDATVPALDHLTMSEMLTMDASDLRETGDGYLVATPRVARTGIQLYAGREVGLPEVKEVRVYRPEAEVFSKDALHTYAFRPVTNDHPPVSVDATNWKKYSVGQTGGEVARDGTFIRVPMVLMDVGAIKDVKSGKRQLSLGYTTDLKWEPGVTEDGEEYDAIQTNIRANHLAVVSAARGGKDLAIGDARTTTTTTGDKRMSEVNLKTMTVDGITCQMTDTAVEIVQRALNTADASLKALKATVAEREASLKAAQEELDAAKKAKDSLQTTSDAQIATLKKQVEDAAMTPAKLDALVRERTTVITKARAIIGDALVIDGKTDAEMRRQVVDKHMGEGAKGWSDEAITASFNTITATVKADGTGGNSRPGGTGPTYHDAASLFSQPGTGAVDQRDAAHSEMTKGLTDAWKTQRPGGPGNGAAV